MKVLRGLVLSILGFLLFMLLAVFGLVFTLHSTILNADFVASEINKLDLPSLAKEIASDYLPQEYKFAAEAVDDVVAEIEPWIKEQASIIIHSTYDYALGKNPNLKVSIALEPVKVKVRDKLRTVLMQSPPPELKDLSPATIDQYFSHFYQQIGISQIPSTFEINENMLPLEVKNAFQEVRHYARYYQPAYWGLIGIIILFILFIFLLQGNLKGTTRSLGITFLLYGALEFAGLWVIRNYTAPFLKIPDIPTTLQSWIPQVLNDVLAPLQTFSLGLLGAGIILIGASFFFRREEAD